MGRIDYLARMIVSTIRRARLFIYDGLVKRVARLVWLSGSRLHARPPLPLRLELAPDVVLFPIKLASSLGMSMISTPSISLRHVNGLIMMTH